MRPCLPALSGLLSLVATALPSAQCQTDKIWQPTSLHPSMGAAVSIADGRFLTGWGRNITGTLSGSVEAWGLSGGDWVFQQELWPADIQGGDRFGSAIDAEGDLAVIASPGADPLGFDSGAAYVWRWDGSAWTEEQRLLPDDGAPNDRFGHAVAISGDRILVSAMQDDGQGSAYSFRFDGESWQQEAKILPPTSHPFQEFGFALDLEGDRAVVNGERLASLPGAVHVFEHDGAEWNLVQSLAASNGQAGDGFGHAVDLDGDRLLIGAPNQVPFSDHPGQAYFFERAGGTWSEVQVVEASQATDDDKFGTAVALDGSTALVGASLADFPAGANRGAAHLYRLAGLQWFEDDVFVSYPVATSDAFGASCALDGDFAAVGAPGADGTSFGNVGAAFLFELTCDIDLYGCTNPNGSLVAGGAPPFLGETFTIGITNTVSSQSTGAIPVVAVSLQPDPAFPCGTPIPGWSMNGNPAGGELLVSALPPNPFLLLTGPPWGGYGTLASVAIDIPDDQALLGLTAHAQGFLVDPSSPQKIGAAQAVRFTIGP